MQLLRCAHLAGSTELKSTSQVLYRALDNNKVDPVGVVLAADTFAIAELAGLAYYRLMLQGAARWQANEMLSDQHRMRLLSGFYNLSLEWRKLRETVLIPRAHATPGRCCSMIWASVWKHAASSSAVRTHEPAAVLELLRTLGEELHSILESGDIILADAETDLNSPPPLRKPNDRCAAALLQSLDARTQFALDWFKRNFSSFFTTPGADIAPPSLSTPGSYSLMDISSYSTYVSRRRPS